jgi:hypothetical protein
VFEPCRKAFSGARPTAIPTIGIRMQQQLSETGINLDCIEKSGICGFPPWLLQSAAVVDSLHHFGSKCEIASDLFRSKLTEMLAVFDGYERIYTDASKDSPAVAASTVSKFGTRVKRIPNDASI